MTLCWFSESNSNFNYKCVIVFSEFFLKIILRYTSSDYFIEPSIFFKKINLFRPIAMLAILTFFWKNSKKMKKTSKNQILRHGVILCVLVASKNNKLDFWQTFQKNPAQKGLSSTNIYRFQSKRPRYDHSRGIVCDSVPVFGT